MAKSTADPSAGDLHQLSSTPNGTAPAASPRAAPHEPPSPAGDPALLRLKEAARWGREHTRQHAVGVAGFGALMFVAGAAPWALPAAFLLFVFTAIPWRIVSFYHRKWLFFCIDFCYFVNLAAALFLLLAPNDARYETLVYALSDGPLAAALAAWQCAWVFGDQEHETSTLMHLLPGLAVFAHRYHTPLELRGWRGLVRCASDLGSCFKVASSATAPAVARPQPLWVWLVVAPLAFYLAWQLLYFLVVQVILRGFIKRGGYDTSYNCLARRAAKDNNFWNRLVRRGSTLRRISMYGVLQLAFTIIAICAFLPTYFCYHAALIYQVIKLWFPIYYGSRHQCVKLPQRALRNALGFQQSGGKKLHGHSHVQLARAHLHAQQKARRQESLTSEEGITSVTSDTPVGSPLVSPGRLGGPGGKGLKRGEVEGAGWHGNGLDGQSELRQRVKEAGVDGVGLRAA